MKWRLWLIPMLLLSLPAPAAAQVKGPVTFSVDVPPGKWKAVRLRNLPKDAVVAVRVQASGEIMVAFLEASDYRRLPAVTRPLFAGRIEKQLSFSVTMPAAGDYFVVFDNRSGSESRAIRVTIQASRGQPKDGTKDRPVSLSISRSVEASTSAALSVNRLETLGILGDWRVSRLCRNVSPVASPANCSQRLRSSWTRW